MDGNEVGGVSTARKDLPCGYVLHNKEGRTYTIKKTLGSGGFGITYLAEAKIRDGNVFATARYAIKEHYLANYCTRADDGSVMAATGKETFERSRQSFVSEARRLQSLSGQSYGELGRCTNIVRVNEVFFANNTAYFVMEYVEGGTLRDFIKSHGNLNDRQTLDLMLPLVDAVARLHEAKFNHLDIKPDNVMVRRGEAGKYEPVLIDFGLSRHFDDSNQATTTIQIQGATQSYAPVEQHLGVDKFSPQADVYALGATLYFCLTGNDPEAPSEHCSLDVEEQIKDSALAPAIVASMSYASGCRPADAAVLARSLRNAIGKPLLSRSHGCDTVPIAPSSDNPNKTEIKVVGNRKS